MNRKLTVLAVLLIAIITVSLLLTVNWFSNNSNNEPKEFYVGIEYALKDYNLSEIDSLVDKVKNYTNLFVLGSIELSFNQTDLSAACDYIANSGLKIIVLFTSSTSYSYNIFSWITQAIEKYGDMFYAVYRYDEPGGDQLSGVSNRLVNSSNSYADAASNYTSGLKGIVDYYQNYSGRVVTADYGLYWFDYQADYNAVFAEFVGNQSRQLHIALCRGAAQAYNRDFGVIVTWKYDQAPYLESGAELYSDLVLAYNSGAKYAVVFSYPRLGPYGTLTEDHFDALQKFWNYANSNWKSFGSSKGEVAYVVPKDYGFGFRGADDTIWGLFNDPVLSSKVWGDVNVLLGKYGSHLDIVYDDAAFYAVKNRYDTIIYWNQTVT